MQTTRSFPLHHLALTTAASLLAMDLVLPGIPALAADLGAPVPLAQGTVSAFFAGLAASQLVWGEAYARIGPKVSLAFAGALLLLASAGCALAHDAGTLVAWRAVQGFACGAAPVIVPALAKALLSPAEAVPAIGRIATIESVVPALGPVAGAALLPAVGWRGLFAALFVISAIAAFASVRAVRALGPNAGTPREPIAGGYGRLLRNRRFLAAGVAHACALGSVLAFVASSPMLLAATAPGPAAFALLQLVGVAAFALSVAGARSWTARRGADVAVRTGARVQVVAAALLLGGSWFELTTLPVLFGFWAAYCAALGVRGPAGFALALEHAGGDLGRASAVVMLLVLAVAAITTQVVAPFLATGGYLPVAGATAMLAVASAIAAVAATRPLPAGRRR